MKTLETLIKLSQQQLDEYRHNLNVYLDKKDELLAKKQRLEQQLNAEKSWVSQQSEVSYNYSNYAAHVSMQQADLDNFVVVMDTQIEEISDKISEAFQELKRYEILLEKRIADEEAERKNKEKIMLDEIGTMNYLRKQKDDYGE